MRAKCATPCSVIYIQIRLGWMWDVRDVGCWMWAESIDLSKAVWELVWAWT